MLRKEHYNGYIGSFRWLYVPNVIIVSLGLPRYVAVTVPSIAFSFAVWGLRSISSLACQKLLVCCDSWGEVNTNPRYSFEKRSCSVYVYIYIYHEISSNSIHVIYWYWSGRSLYPMSLFSTLELTISAARSKILVAWANVSCILHIICI